MTEIRPLQPSDFYAIWEYGLAFMPAQLRPDLERARQNYMYLLSDNSSLSLGGFKGECLVGAIMVAGMKNAYAQKGYANVQLWFGSVALLDAAIKWWEGRPVLKFLSLQFPSDVRPGMYRLLRMRGFSRAGDMNMLWRH